MNRLDPPKQAQVVAALVEGNSIRAIVRMTGVAKNTIQKLLVALGAACCEYMGETLVNLPASASSATKFGASSAPSKRT